MEEKQRNEARGNSDNLLPEQKFHPKSLINIPQLRAQCCYNHAIKNEMIQNVFRETHDAADAEGQGYAKYSFNAQSPLELSFKKGDIVTLIRQIDENWFEGRYNNKTGIFPKSYIEVIREPIVAQGFTTPAN